jgi:hypothetical protein
MDIPLRRLDLSHLFDTPTEYDTDFFTKPTSPTQTPPLPLSECDDYIDFESLNVRGIDCSPPDDFDSFMDSLPNFPMPPTTVPSQSSQSVPLDPEFREWLESPSLLSTTRNYPTSSRRNRFDRPSSPGSLPKPLRKKRTRPKYHLKALLNATKQNMDRLKEEGVDVRDWEEFFGEMKKKLKR